MNRLFALFLLAWLAVPAAAIADGGCVGSSDPGCTACRAGFQAFAEQELGPHYWNTAAGLASTCDAGVNIMNISYGNIGPVDGSPYLCGISSNGSTADTIIGYESSELSCETVSTVLFVPEACGSQQIMDYNLLPGNPCQTCPETSTPNAEKTLCVPDEECRDDQIVVGGLCQCPPGKAPLLGQCVDTDCGPGAITTVTDSGYQCSCPENSIPLLGSQLEVVGCTTTFCSTNPTHWTCRDTDNDGIPDPDDDDDDNDGIPDPIDPDDDNDGDLDTEDEDHRNYNKPDQDQDGIPDPEDPDVDGDGIPNPDDPDYLEQPDLLPPDSDGDGETDDLDRDDDNDGIPDPRDDDRDGDGNRDDLDAIPDPNTCDPSVDPSCQGGGGTCVPGFTFNESTRECLPIRGDANLGNCQNDAISCVGDPLDCASIQLRYTEYCENNRGDAASFGADLFDGSEVGGAGTEDVGFDTLVYDTDVGACPAPIAISIPFFADNLELTYQPMCDLVTQLRLVFIFIGSLVGLRINYRALTS